MKNLKFYKIITPAFIAVVLLLFLTVFTDVLPDMFGRLGAQLVQMSFVIHPAPSITTGEETFSPSQTESHSFAALSEDFFTFTNPDESFIKMLFSPDTTSVSIDFFIHSYDENFVIFDRPLPSGLDVIGDMFYDFVAFEGSTEKKTFDANFTLEFHYTDDQIAAFEEGTLKVYFWDEVQNVWVPLPNFTLDQINNTISVFTDHLTLFAIFGEPKGEAPPEGFGGMGGSLSFIISGPTVEEEVSEVSEEIVPEEELVSEEEIPPEEVPLPEEREEEIPPEKITEAPRVTDVPTILLDVSLTIEAKYKEVYPGDDLLIQGEIIKFEPKGRIDIPLHYQIKDENDVVILDHTETMAIETRLSFLKTFYIVEGAVLGIYTIYLEVPYDDTSVSSSDTFGIVKRPLFIISEEISVISEGGAKRMGLVLGISLIIFFIFFVLGLWKMWTIIRKINGEIK